MVIMKPPYLQAIQEVAGATPGEKHRTLNHFIWKIVKEYNDLGLIEVRPSEGLPEPLIPLMKLEIARILEKPEGIIEALKSEDQTVFNRALKVKWFFNGSTPNYPNANHFREHIFPYLSVNNRAKLIRVLVKNLALNEPGISELFYSTVREMYGNNQAQPLLKACSESFIWNTIIQCQVVFNVSDVKYIFFKYPDLVIRYLKLEKSDDPSKINLHKIPFEDYKKFLPRLLKKHSQAFAELIRMYNSTLNINLNNHYTEMFLKNEMDTFIRNPQIFLNILSFKKVSYKLSSLQFGEILQELLPKEMADFEFDKMLNYLKYIPEDQKMSIMMSSFKDVYKVSLLNCTDKITPEALRLLPHEERIKQARRKLETDKNWYIKSYEKLCYSKSSEEHMNKSWRCYLSTKESIPFIKDKISDSEDTDKLALLTQMIYTCKVNNDIDALLEVLKYASTLLEGERTWDLMEFLLNLSEEFELKFLPWEHLQIICNFVKSMEKDNRVRSLEQISSIRKIIECGIRSDLNRNLSITEKINHLTEFTKRHIREFCSPWNIVCDNPLDESACLDEFAKLIPTIFFKHKQTSSTWQTGMTSFVKAIYSFNKRCSESKAEHNKISISKYPWLLDSVEKLIESNNIKDDNLNIDDFKLLLKTNEPTLFPNIKICNENNKPKVKLTKILSLLKENSQEILDNFQEYYLECEKNISRKSTQRFLKTCRWYQDLPIKFFEKSVSNIAENKKKEAIIVLATLLNGSEFEKIITPYISELLTDIAEEGNYCSNLSLVSFIFSSLKAVDSPVNLDFILLFSGHYYFETDKCYQILLNLGQRVSIDKLLPFCGKLTDQKQKHGIQMFCIAATISQIQTMFANSWKKKINFSMNHSLVKNVLNIFKAKPCSETWGILAKCLNFIESNDNEKVIRTIGKYDRIPNFYLIGYIRRVLTLIKTVENTEKNLKPFGAWYHTIKLFKNLPVNVAGLFSEKFHEELMETYLINLSLPKEVLSAAQRYLVDCYLLPAGEKLESRLGIFLKKFEKILQNEWDASHPKNSNFYPANFFVNELVQSIIFHTPYSVTKIKLINATLYAYLSVLKPEQAPEFYCNFSIAALYDDKMTPAEFTKKLTEIFPSLMNIFSAEFMYVIAQYLYKLINHFYNSDAQFDVMKKLLGFDNNYTNSLTAALLLLCQKNQRNDKRLLEIVRIFRKHRHPVAISSAYVAMVDSVFMDSN